METSLFICFGLLICFANPSTGFCMIGTYVNQELNEKHLFKMPCLYVDRSKYYVEIHAKNLS